MTSWTRWIKSLSRGRRSALTQQANCVSGGVWFPTPPAGNQPHTIKHTLVFMTSAAKGWVVVFCSSAPEILTGPNHWYWFESDPKIIPDAVNLNRLAQTEQSSHSVGSGLTLVLDSDTQCGRPLSISPFNAVQPAPVWTPTEPIHVHFKQYNYVCRITGCTESTDWTGS